jgi:hypothetical protein
MRTLEDLLLRKSGVRNEAMPTPIGVSTARLPARMAAAAAKKERRLVDSPGGVVESDGGNGVVIGLRLRG